MKDRRDLLKFGAFSVSWFLTSGVLLSCDSSGGTNDETEPPTEPLPPRDLLPPNSDGLMLPQGFTSRIVARSGSQPVPSSSSYRWHNAPDGGATFVASDGGWVYVSNSEISGSGGAGALRFDANGTLIDTYSILESTTRNCAGGATPWGTWLSCEETNRGLVYETDPMGVESAQALPALGAFKHEAVAVDPNTHVLYLTEDENNGRLYRFTPIMANVGARANLSNGLLEVMEVTASGPTGAVIWHVVPDAGGSPVLTRNQVSQSTAFDGGEGIAYDQGNIYFVTKGDNRVWVLDIVEQKLDIIYDRSDPVVTSPAQRILSGVDNVVVGPSGEVLIAEDGGDMQIVAINAPSAEVFPLLQVSGHNNSEIAGPAFSPDFTRLYFSSQRGSSGRSSGGITFEVSGPFGQLI